MRRQRVTAIDKVAACAIYGRKPISYEFSLSGASARFQCRQLLGGFVKTTKGLDHIVHVAFHDVSSLYGVRLMR
jgi:hypothetical protein